MTEEHRQGLCRWRDEMLGRFYSTPWGQHLKEARKEILLAVRAIIDHKIEWLDTLGKESEPRKIEVQ
ncbi:MAG: hypothetical protein ACUVX8_07920 [Candidatus Zipacnadales bacterium]